MSKFREPWSLKRGEVADNDGDLLHEHEGLAERAVACVNALTGVPDPLRLFGSFDEMLTILKHNRSVLKHVTDLEAVIENARVASGGKP